MGDTRVTLTNVANSKNQETQQPQKTTETRKRHEIRPRESYQGIRTEVKKSENYNRKRGKASKITRCERANHRR